MLQVESDKVECGGLEPDFNIRGTQKLAADVRIEYLYERVGNVSRESFSPTTADKIVK